MFCPVFVFPDLFAFKWFNFIDHLNSRGNFPQGRKLINLWQKPCWCFIQFYSLLLLEPIQRSSPKFIFWRRYEWIPFGKYIKILLIKKQFFSLANCTSKRWLISEDDGKFPVLGDSIDSLRQESSHKLSIYWLCLILLVHSFLYFNVNTLSIPFSGSTIHFC